MYIEHSFMVLFNQVALFQMNLDPYLTVIISSLTNTPPPLIDLHMLF